VVVPKALEGRYEGLGKGRRRVRYADPEDLEPEETYEFEDLETQEKYMFATKGGKGDWRAYRESGQETSKAKHREVQTERAYASFDVTKASKSKRGLESRPDQAALEEKGDQLLEAVVSADGLKVHLSAPAGGQGAPKIPGALEGLKLEAAELRKQLELKKLQSTVEELRRSLDSISTVKTVEGAPQIKPPPTPTGPDGSVAPKAKRAKKKKARSASPPEKATQN
jgi:hypothetical protein